MPERAIVLGNGESRSLIKSSILENKIIVGCNAIHRDLIVDHLICCDQRMVRESLSNPNTRNTKIYVRDFWYFHFRKVQKNKNIELLPELPYQGDKRPDKPIHWGSGSYAVLIGALQDVNHIELVGFDLYSNNSKINNMYKGTENYSGKDSPAVDHSYWLYQIGKVFSNFPGKQFTIYNNKNWKFPMEWQKNNVTFVAL